DSSRMKSDENVGRAPTWSAMLLGEESLRVRLGSKGWSVEAADAEPYVPCGSDASIEVPDSEAIMEHGAVSGLNVDFRMTHACVVGGTCGNVWVSTMDSPSSSPGSTHPTVPTS